MHMSIVVCEYIFDIETTIFTDISWLKLFLLVRLSYNGEDEGVFKYNRFFTSNTVWNLDDTYMNDNIKYKPSNSYRESCDYKFAL